MEVNDINVNSPNNQSKLSSVRKDEREWKNSTKSRKVDHGFMAPTDERFQMVGKLRGFKVFLDENEAICGLSPIVSTLEG